jgi:hypothetical protein
MQVCGNDTKLIPPSETVRAELARSVRETRRLRSLLRLSARAEDDHRYVEALRQRSGTAPQPAAARPEGVSA